MTVFVLWEDRAAGDITRFGPHTFLIAGVASILGSGDRHSLMKSGAVRGKACKGNGNVLRELASEPLWDSIAHVIAVLDTDEIHDRLPGLSARRTVDDAGYTAWLSEAVARVRMAAPPAAEARLDVCFLDRNLESLLSIIGHGSHELPLALAKDVLARDKLLHRAAADPGLVGKAHDGMASWRALVETVAQRIRRS